MGLTILLLLPLCFPGFRGQSPEETRREGSSLLLKCPYTAQQGQQQLLSWGRVIGDQLQVLAEAWSALYSTTKEVTAGRVVLRVDSSSRTATIIMANLQAEDSGTYCCTLRSSHYSKHLPLKSISLNVYKEVHKWELDTLSEQCRYRDLKHSTMTRVWCRRGPSGCHIWLRTNSTWANSRGLEGRVLMQDDTQKGTVTVTMMKLQARDAGTYWCALQRNWQLVRVMEIRLFVSKRAEDCTAKESGNITVQCLYNFSDLSPASKAWCRKEAGKPCTLLASTDTKSSWFHKTPQQGRVTIQDDSLQGIVTVTMSSLQAEDSGVYWCALQEQERLLRMLEVNLSVPQASNGTTLSAAANSSQETPAANTLAPSMKIFLLLSVVLSILLILTLVVSAVLCVWWCKQLRRRGTRQGEDTCGKPEGMAQVESTERKESPKNDSKDLKYATLNFEAQLSPEDALYCNIEPSQAHRRPRDDDVQYAIIGLQQLPASGKD